jgi:hypothetical protein
VLEDEQVRLALPGDPDEGLVVVFDHADHFLTAGHLHADRRRFFDQLFEVAGLLKRLLGRARGFSALLCRTRVS